MEVASDLRFRVAISEAETPSFYGVSGDLAPSTWNSLAIPIVRFWCAKRRVDIIAQLWVESLRRISPKRIRSFPLESSIEDPEIMGNRNACFSHLKKSGTAQSGKAPRKLLERVCESRDKVSKLLMFDDLSPISQLQRLPLVLFCGSHLANWQSS